MAECVSARCSPQLLELEFWMVYCNCILAYQLRAIIVQVRVTEEGVDSKMLFSMDLAGLVIEVISSAMVFVKNRWCY